MIFIVISLILFVVGLIINYFIYLTLHRCLRKQQEGKIYVKLRTDIERSGWILNRDLISINNNMKAMEEHIRVESKSEVLLIQVSSIREIRTIENMREVILGNL